MSGNTEGRQDLIQSADLDDRELENIAGGANTEMVFSGDDKENKNSVDAYFPKK